jgi:hypothetical protein
LGKRLLSIFSLPRRTIPKTDFCPFFFQAFAILCSEAFVPGGIMRRLSTAVNACIVRLFPAVTICVLFSSAACLTLAGCDNSRPTDQQVQQQAAQATATAKEGAKQAVAATQVAAAEAERGLNDVAAGVKQVIHEDAPPVDLNTASQIRLATLPGISLSKAGDIVNGRPYSAPHQLVSRGLLTRDQFARIATQVTAGK